MDAEFWFSVFGYLSAAVFGGIVGVIFSRIYRLLKKLGEPRRRA